MAVICLFTAFPAAAQIELRLHRVESYIPSFPVKRQMNHTYRPELDKLQSEMHRRMAAGETLMCTAQIFQETEWLVNYTDRAEDIERRLDELRKSFEKADQTFATRQDPRDGSFGPCYESWIWRFFSSVDPLKELALQGKKPEHPLKIWEPVDTPGEIEALFTDLMISDVDSGYNKRKELNFAVTALGQLLWLDYTDAVFPEHLDRANLAEVLKNFVETKWQDPDTGYWGAWYRDDGQIEKTNDLSMTFHIVSYLEGKVSRLREIARTTFAIRNVKYPYGWNSRGLQNNHHAYDVVRILNLTWEELDEAERAAAGAHVYLLTARALALSIDDNGAFVSAPYATVGEAYYFGISFFAEVGLFGNSVPRSRRIEITNAEGLLERITANLRTLDRSDPWVVAAERKLQSLAASVPQEKQ